MKQNIFPNNIIQALFYTVLCFLVITVLILVLGQFFLNQNYVILFSELIGFPIVLFFSWYFLGYQVGDVFGETKLFPRLVIPIILLTISIYLLQAIPTYFLLAGPENYSIQILSFHYDWSVLISIFFTASIFEELVYRDFLFRRLLSTKSFWFSAILSSFLFSLSHLNFDNFINLFILGIFISFVFYKTKSLLLCFIIHIVYGLGPLFLKFYYDKQQIDKVLSISLIYGENSNVVFFVLLLIMILGVIFVHNSLYKTKNISHENR
ncbi:CAAX amino terminal protease family protein [Croceitalea dokdonensis DOKDO 023]|uniref:CAAX amino terminal protease family protein n=1 Tax=Croceitalea dokdonensis DOKDO 023 TaxID=1300341 RepID=A0A0P7AXA7_9FLAO|nr:CAAX amino terminal protease family protein [Croceitalea dokdonensis DOKDO 023]